MTNDDLRVLMSMASRAARESSFAILMSTRRSSFVIGHWSLVTGIGHWQRAFCSLQLLRSLRAMRATTAMTSLFVVVNRHVSFVIQTCERGSVSHGSVRYGPERRGKLFWPKALREEPCP